MVLADEGVNRRLAPDHGWDEVVALVLAGIRRGALVDGLVAGITRCGEILEGPLPPGAENPDEIRAALVLED
jgi:putative membrane protein